MNQRELKSMKIKFRQDLEFTRRVLELDEYWVVKDPISFKHFLFSSQEYQLLQLFDGVRTDEDIQRIWQERFRTKSLSIEQVRRFGNRLTNDNLVAVDEFGYGQVLFENQRTSTAGRFKELLMSPLVIRFRGFNPKSILDGLSWFGWILFHPLVVICLLYTSPSPRDKRQSRMPSSA